MIVYKVTSLSGKCYIGKTIRSLHERKLDHISTAHNKNNKLYDTKFSRAIRKYGDNLVWKEIDSADTEERLGELEIEIIERYDSFRNGYNSTLGGEGCSGREVSEETRKKLSKIISGTKRNFSDEHRANLSKAKSGKNLSEEHKKKISDGVSGENNPMYGKIFSDEHKEKLSKAHKGKKLIKETKKKISKNHSKHMLGKKHSSQTREKISKANKRNQNRSKRYLIICPNGESVVVFNLAKFCRDNGLSKKCMFEVAAGRNKQHRGHKINRTN